MSFQITNVSGAQENVTSIDAVDALVAELDHADLEHPAKAVVATRTGCRRMPFGDNRGAGSTIGHDLRDVPDGTVIPIVTGD